MISIHKENDGALLLNLNLKEANLENADEFKADLITLLDDHQKKVVLDMHQVEYIDSSFLGALVAALKYAISLKLDIALVGLRKDINDLFELIRLDKVFKIYPSFDDIPANQ